MYQFLKTVYMNEQNLFTVCVKLHNNVHNLKNRILCIKIQISKSKQFIREEQTYTQFTHRNLSGT